MWPAFLAPRGHPPGEVAGDVPHPDGRGEADRLDRVLVVAAHEDDRPAGLGQPGQLGAEARAPRGDRDRARDVRLVELQLGAHVDYESAGLLDLARRERV